MKTSNISIQGKTYPVISFTVAVIGSGAAGFNAAHCLYKQGVTDVALFTENVNSGTSRNTGSDKQTYYKLSLSGGADSVAQMAQTLFDGGGVNGDTAYAEAAGSVRGFLKLAELGVPFPTNELGEYVGYKTDHDPLMRGSSAGPLTSKFMTECLERAVRELQIPIMDGYLVAELLTSKNEDGTTRVQGFICLHGDELCIVYAPYIVLCTGGPAGLYETSVYPVSQWGMSGMALRAGAKAQNLSEWQYGLASTDFRWNVSGSYQQVLPRYISVDVDGTEHEFLSEYFDSEEAILQNEFLKGYQWPLDKTRLEGSSRVDLAVYTEMIEKGRSVFMDFRRNPTELDPSFTKLSEEAYSYLDTSGAMQATPVERLKALNLPAYEWYKQNGIDLETEPLRIALCAQHHNGGLWVDAHWETSISGLFAAGECAGTFGEKRPGGSALNSTQVGSARAADEIAFRVRKNVPVSAELCEGQIDAFISLLGDAEAEEANIAATRKAAQHFMSAYAGPFRDTEKIREELDRLPEEIHYSKASERAGFIRLRDMLETKRAVLSAMLAREELGAGLLLTSRFSSNHYVSYKETPRPLPTPETWFEKAWGAYRERHS